MAKGRTAQPGSADTANGRTFLAKVVKHLEAYQDRGHRPMFDEDNLGTAQRMTDAMVEATGMELTDDNALVVAAVVQAFTDQMEVE